MKKRGRPKSENPKKLVSLRLDRDVLDYFKADGPGWQTRINAELRKEMDYTDAIVEEIERMPEL